MSEVDNRNSIGFSELGEGPLSKGESGDRSHCDIAIVGGGMMGASLALMASKALPKANIVMLEAMAYEPNNAATLASFDGRSTALAPTTVDMFKQLGLWPQLSQQACAIERVHVSDKGQPGLLNLSKTDNQGQALGYVVENTHLGQVLMAAVRANSNIQLRAPLVVNKLKPKSKGVTLDCSAPAGAEVRAERAEDVSSADNHKASAQGEEPESLSLDARLVLIADGADSQLRKQLGISERVEDYQQHAIVANIAFDRSHQGVAYERFTGQGPLAVLPRCAEQGRASALVWTWPSAQVDQAMAMSDTEFTQALQKQLGYRLGPVVKLGARQSYPLKLRLAEEQVRTRVVLMGNAAHFLHPVAGQGFNLAVRDAARLIQILREAPFTELGELKHLQRYQDSQLRDQQRTVLLSNGFNRLFRSSSSAVGWLRALGFLSLELNKSLRKTFIQQLSGQAHGRARPFDAVPTVSDIPVEHQESPL